MEKATAAMPGPASSIASDLDRMLAQQAAASFCRRAAEVTTATFAASCVGVNFAGGQLLSLKLYFTFFERLDAKRLALFIDNPRLIEDFLASSRGIEKGPALDPAAPGSGFTFCVKVDRSLSATHGYYHRAARAPLGHFVLYDGERRDVKRYVYVDDRRLKSALARRVGLPYLADCETIEHAQGASHGIAGADEKFILIGNFAVIRPQLYAPEEAAMVAALEARHALRAACGAVIPNRAKSVYLVAAGMASGGRVRTIEGLYRSAAAPPPGS